MSGCNCCTITRRKELVKPNSHCPMTSNSLRPQECSFPQPTQKLKCCNCCVITWRKELVKPNSRCPMTSGSRRQPTAPASAILSSMRRFISTAYSIGSSLMIGSMNPATIIVVASSSVRPRLMR